MNWSPQNKPPQEAAQYRLPPPLSCLRLHFLEQTLPFSPSVPSVFCDAEPLRTTNRTLINKFYNMKYKKLFLLFYIKFNIAKSGFVMKIKTYILEIKKRIKRINAFISNPLNYENLNNPFFSTRSRTYVWIEENKEN